MQMQFYYGQQMQQTQLLLQQARGENCSADKTKDRSDRRALCTGGSRDRGRGVVRCVQNSVFSGQKSGVEGRIMVATAAGRGGAGAT